MNAERSYTKEVYSTFKLAVDDRDRHLRTDRAIKQPRTTLEYLRGRFRLATTPDYAAIHNEAIKRPERALEASAQDFQTRRDEIIQEALADAALAGVTINLDQSGQVGLVLSARELPQQTDTL